MIENKPPYLALLIVLLAMLGIVTATAITGDLMALLAGVGILGGSLLLMWAMTKTLIYLSNWYEQR